MKRIKRRMLLAGTTALAAAATLTLATPAQAALACSVGALSDLQPGVTIVSATTVAATATVPAYCDVTGSLNTSGAGAPAGSAAFELRLPAVWNNKFLFFGVGGLAGSTYGDFSANPVDLQEALPLGYATAITDEGHTAGNTDASWALLANGQPDRAKLADYYNRATHEVTVAAKALVAAYYGGAISYAYFDGCSNGGRQAMVEASQFPTDYDGIIAGAPFLDIRTIMGGDKDAKALFSTPNSYLPATLLPAIDAAVYQACDAADGVTDGLIQNPARCSVRPADLVCRNGATANCLNRDQAAFLETYISALRTPAGDLVYPGYSITDLANGGMDAWTVGFTPPTAPTSSEPWGNHGFSPAPYGYQFVDHILQDIVTRDPTADFRSFPVTADGVVTDQVVRQFDARTGAGDAGSPFDYAAFIAQGRKLIWYHGLSDPALPPFRDYVLYEQLARATPGSFATLQKNIRLFMVPGMQHCGGGPGPNLFDTITPLSAWVEQGTPPNAIIATHFPGNNPAAGTPDRQMPLCPFPTEATYVGGTVTQASSWSCTPNRRMLQVGVDGRAAGLLPGGAVDIPPDTAP